MTAATAAGVLQRDVLLIDDHRVFAQALACAIDAEGDLRCVATASSVREGLEKARVYAIDAAVIDLRLPDAGGLTALAGLRAARPAARLIVLTGYPSAAAAAEARACGAHAFLPKDGELRDVLAAIRGDDRAASRAAPQRPGAAAAPTAPRLTPREHQVLSLMADGRDARRIARDLDLSLHTVRGYIKTVLAKLDARSQLDAVVAAAQLGLVSVGDRVW